MRSPGVIIGDVLLHPLSLTCTALWAVNDHVWKQQYASWWTGKLSDVCSLVVFPLFLFSSLQLVLLILRNERPRKAHLYAIVGGVAVAFSAINLLEAGDAAYRCVVALLNAPAETMRHPWLTARLVHHTSDATDLLTLPALTAALWVAAPHCDSTGSTRRQRACYHSPT